MGKRPELVGGGLRRSQAMNRAPEEIMDFDDRILGSGALGVPGTGIKSMPRMALV